MLLSHLALIKQLKQLLHLLEENRFSDLGSHYSAENSSL